MPLTYGARRLVERAISRGEFTPNWTIVGGALGDVVKSDSKCSVFSQFDAAENVQREANVPESRAKTLRLNSLAKI